MASAGGAVAQKWALGWGLEVPVGHMVVGKAVWSRKEPKAAGARAASIAASNGCHRPRHESGMSQEAHVRRPGGDKRAAVDEEGDERRYPQHPSKGLSARAARS